MGRRRWSTSRTVVRAGHSRPRRSLKSACREPSLLWKSIGRKRPVVQRVAGMSAQTPPPDVDVPGRREPGERPEPVRSVRATPGGGRSGPASPALRSACRAFSTLAVVLRAPAPTRWDWFREVTRPKLMAPDQMVRGMTDVLSTQQQGPYERDALPMRLAPAPVNQDQQASPHHGGCSRRTSRPRGGARPAGGRCARVTALTCGARPSGRRGPARPSPAPAPRERRPPWRR